MTVWISVLEFLAWIIKTVLPFSCNLFMHASAGIKTKDFQKA